MDYDDDLNAPVWDDLNPPKQASVPELSDTFADLNTDEANQGEEEEEDEGVNSGEETHTAEHENSDNLLNTLAPQELSLIHI